MDFRFVPVEEFYFALTLAVRTLEELAEPGLAARIGAQLDRKLGQPSTVAAAPQNTYNYVFQVKDVDNSPNPSLIVSLSDWQGSFRISSDYGWTLDEARKPTRTEKFSQRGEFAEQVLIYLRDWLEINV